MKIKLLALLPFFWMGCTGPKNIIHTGKVTEKGKFALGANSSYNIPTATVKALFGSLEDAVEKSINRDSVIVDSSFNKQVEAMAIYSLDPLGPNFDLYVRYGLFNNIDIGYSWASGIHVFDGRYQFLNRNKLFGSAGVQYSWQSYELPSFLGSLQSFLKYELKRKDLLVPIAFSNSIGENEKYGAVGYGLVYGRTWITYDYKPNAVYEVVSNELEEVNDIPRGSNSFNVYGSFLNLKLGYKYVYGILGLSLYYQNYGEYNLFLDQKAEFSGFNFIPNLGIQFVF